METADWFWPTVAGIVGSAILSGLLSWLFFWVGSRDLRKRTDTLLGQLVLALRALEGSGAVHELARNEAGEFIGISHPLSATARSSLSASAAKLTVAPKMNQTK